MPSSPTSQSSSRLMTSESALHFVLISCCSLSFLSILTNFLIFSPPFFFFLFQGRREEDRPVWVWRLRVHQPSAHVGGRVCVRGRGVCAHAHHTTHTLMHVFTWRLSVFKLHVYETTRWHPPSVRGPHTCTSRTLICQIESHTLPFIATCP